MRIYTYDIGQIPKVLEAWAKAIPDREKFSPPAGVRPIRQENKLLVPAAFSPVR
jgi:hypothetical protein